MNLLHAMNISDMPLFSPLTLVSTTRHVHYDRLGIIHIIYYNIASILSALSRYWGKHILTIIDD